MSSKKVVRAYTGNDEYARNLRRAEAAGAEVVSLNNVPLEANMTFGQASLEFKDDRNCKGRPVLHLDEGKVTSIYGDLPFNVIQARFSEYNAPVIAVDWDLTNKEIAQLVEKGIFGSDYDIDPSGNNPKPKGPVQVPSLFTEVEFERIPITANVLAMESEGIPVISIDVTDQYNLKTNSRVSGYEDIAKYFKPQEFYAEGQYVDKSKYFVALEDENLIGVEKVVLEEVQVEDNVVKSEVFKSKEEQAEEAHIAAMTHEVNQRIELVLDETQIEDSDNLAESIEPTDVETEVEVPDDVAFSEEMLADMHLIDTDDADKEKAEAKVTVSVMEQTAEQIEKAQAEDEQKKREAQISEAMAEGNKVADREARESVDYIQPK